MKTPVQRSQMMLVAILILIFNITNVTTVSAAKKTKNHNASNSSTALQMILRSIGGQDGWILESSENSSIGNMIDKESSYLYLGDTIDRRQYRNILSFKTSSLPDNAIISSAYLKIKQFSIIGIGNPVNIMGGFIVDIVSGYFGTYAALQISDFQIASNGTDGPMHPALSAGNIYKLNLRYIKNFINKTSKKSGLTQIRLGFDIDDNHDAFANILQIYSGDAPSMKDRPQLIINYTIP